MNMPIIKLTDGSSGGGSVSTIKTHGWSYVPGVPGFIHAVKGLNMGIPNLAAVLGPAVRFQFLRSTSVMPRGAFVHDYRR